MNKKKILMIVILVAFIACIGVVILKINEKSVEAGKKSENSQEAEANIIEITDNYFIEQTNDIFLNLKDYVGKTVKMQGLVYAYAGEDGNTYYAVVRNTLRMLPEMMA